MKHITPPLFDALYSQIIPLYANCICCEQGKSSIDLDGSSHSGILTF